MSQRQLIALLALATSCGRSDLSTLSGSLAGAPGGAEAADDAPCTGSRCLVTLASGETYSYGITVDDDAVYWTSSGSSIKTVRKSGGTPQVLIGAQWGAFAITVDATNVYWTTTADDLQNINSSEFGTIMQAPLRGGPATVIASRQPYASESIAVDSTSIYWLTTKTVDYPSGSVMKAPIGGGALTTLASNEYSPTGIVVDETSVYWTTQDYAVRKVAKVGGTAVTLGPMGRSPLALYGGYVYGFGGVGIQRISTHGGAPTSFATTVNPNSTAIAVDADGIYWTVPSQDGVLQKMSLDGTTETTLASHQRGPWPLALDATSVYWINTEAGTVMRLRTK
jgi:hypothetical protein